MAYWFDEISNIETYVVYLKKYLSIGYRIFWKLYFEVICKETKKNCVLSICMQNKSMQNEAI